MFLDLTGGLFLSGCSVVLLGGLYFKRGTTTAAFTSMITGIVLTISGFLYRIYDPEFLNGTVMSFYIALICIAEYVIVSLLSKDVNVDLNELLNRRKEDIEVRKNLKWYQLSPEVPRCDRIIIPCMYVAIALFIVAFIGAWIYNSFVDISTEKWVNFWYVYICAMFSLGGAFLLWVIAGGFRDLFRLFRNLKTQKVDVTDDGRVTAHHTDE
jgi:SSS family solute:Na+ symporter